MLALGSRGQSSATNSSAAPAAGSSQSAPSRHAPRRDGLLELEKQLFSPFASSQDGDLGRGPLDPPPAPAPQVSTSRKARLEEERQKNWAFLTPEELMGTTPMDDVDGSGADGKAGSGLRSLSLLEEYYHRQEHPGKDLKKDNSSQFSSAKGEKRGNNQRLANPFEQDRKADFETRRDSFGMADSRDEQRPDSEVDQGVFNHSSTVSDIFGLGHSEPTAAELQAHKDRMQEFQRLLNNTWRPAGMDLPSANSSLGAASAAGSSPETGLPGNFRADDPNAASLGIPSLTGGVSDPLQNLNAPTWQPSSTSLNRTPAPSLTPPVPTFTAPRRQF